MAEPGNAADLVKRVSALERENRLLQIGVKQLTRIREQWTRSLDELKATKSRLQVSNQFLDRLLRTAPLPVLVLTKPRGRIVMANMAAETLIGVDADGLTGISALRLLDHQARSDLLQRYRAPVAKGATAEPVAVNLLTRAGQVRRLEVHWAESAGLPGERERLVVIAQDVTERQAAAEQLRLAGRIIENTPQGIVVLDREQRIMSINPAGCELAGVPAASLIGQSAGVLPGPDHVEALFEVLAKVAGGLDQWQGETRFGRRDGNTYPAWVAVLSLKNSAGQLSNYIMLFMDITVRKQTEDRLRFQSMHDALTGLPNRVQYRDQLERSLALAQRGKLKVGVMFLDLDGFKHVNDAYGHDAGDDLLKQVSARLQSAIRATDTIARFGGDEFAAILLGIHEVRNIEIVARKILAAVSPPYHLKADIAKISVSIGISVFPDDAQDIDALMKFADMAMYRVKAAGKDSYQFFTPDMNLEASRRMNMVSRMERGLEQGEFIAHYQPQVDIRSGRFIGVEALIRWNDPGQGLVPPGAFIGLAEETGMINALGEQILYAACRQAVAWHGQGLAGLTVSINLSAKQFRDRDLPALIRRVLAETGITPTCLVLEITESTIMTDLEATERMLREIRALGVLFSLDDFGTGYASMAYLKRLPFNHLKIDRQFIRDMETDPHDVAITDAIIRMAAALELTVVAEGVETLGQLRLLESLNCDCAQGYYFARPLPPEECFRLLTSVLAPDPSPPLTNVVLSD